MTLRSMPDTIESLRVLLKTVEQTTGVARNSADLAELRRILVHRIAELEIAQASIQGAAATPALREDDYKLAS